MKITNTAEPAKTLRTNPIPVNLTEQQLKNFWAKVNKTETCWLWTACVKQRGAGRPNAYGMFQIGRKSYMAHRISWQLHNGLIPDGLFVLHDCPGGDNVLCVRPDHLWLGTIQDNCFDMVEKGGHGSATRPERTARGDRLPQTKLTPEIVSEIRRLVGSGEKLQREMADKYQLSQSTVSQIISRKYWKHVP